ncbi:MAG TPA: hypothetical protein VLA21_11885 [Candidatus Limnocylindria bacterium]|nr:hypothetical protein [Candidatus Limnocylindria bacterium]
MESFDEKLKRIVNASIGAITSAVEKSRDAIIEFAESEKVKEFSEKGEQVLGKVFDAGASAVDRVKGFAQNIDARDEESRRKARLVDLAYRMQALTPEERQEVGRLVNDLEENMAKSERESSQTPEAPEGGIGQYGVKESPFDLKARQVNEHHGEEATISTDPLAHTSPTYPEDELNSKRQQTNNMNDHLNQGVPPDHG